METPFSTYCVTMKINGMLKSLLKISTCQEDAELKAKSTFAAVLLKYELISIHRVGDAFFVKP